MYVVVTTSGEDEKKGMPLLTFATAKGYAATKAYDLFDGDVDSVQIVEIDDEDLRSARDRVLAGEGKVVAEVEQAVTDDRRQREELREATRLLASIGFGSTSRNAD